MTRTENALELLISLSEYLKFNIELENDNKKKYELYSYLLLINSLYKLVNSINLLKEILNSFIKNDIFDFTDSVVTTEEEKEN